jgi:hypothetical protein
MGLDVTSILILAGVAGLGSVAGYLGRISQKLEDKRDKTFLTELPGIYSNLLAFQEDLTSFNNGDTLDQFFTNLKETNKSLQEQIFAADILIFKPELYRSLYAFFRDGKNLQTVVEHIEGLSEKEKVEEEDSLREFSKKGQKYGTGKNLVTNPTDVFNKAKTVSDEIGKSFKGYHSYSVTLMLIIFALGAIVAILEIIHGLIKI